MKSLTSKDLKQEHDAILIALDVIEKMRYLAHENKNIDYSDIKDMIGFLKIFADKCHHGKEENHFFPALEKAGVPKEGGPIGVMLKEHEQGRKLIQQMQSSISDNGLDKEMFTEAASAYTELLRNHIEKENNILFPMGDARLSESQQKDIFNDFEKLETDVIGEGKHEELHSLLESMKEKYL